VASSHYWLFRRLESSKRHHAQNSIGLFDLQKSIQLLFRLAPGILNNEEALEVKNGFRPELFDPLKQTIRAQFSCFWMYGDRLALVGATRRVALSPLSQDLHKKGHILYTSPKCSAGQSLPSLPTLKKSASKSVTRMCSFSRANNDRTECSSAPPVPSGHPPHRGAYHPRY
jgi:hypothetical protein